MIQPMKLLKVNMMNKPIDIQQHIRYNKEDMTEEEKQEILKNASKEVIEISRLFNLPPTKPILDALFEAYRQGMTDAIKKYIGFQKQAEEKMRNNLEEVPF